MDAVYRRKRNPAERRTWIDHFMEVEPTDGVGAVVRKLWEGQAEPKS
jgi:hypothetical protein